MAKQTVYLSEKARGLKIVLRPTERIYDREMRKFQTVPGEAIQFEDGRYSTDDPEKIKFLDEYIKTHPNIYCLNLRLKKDHENMKKQIDAIEGQLDGDPSDDQVEAAAQKLTGKTKPKGKQGAIG